MCVLTAASQAGTASDGTRARITVAASCHTQPRNASEDATSPRGSSARSRVANPATWYPSITRRAKSAPQSGVAPHIAYGARDTQIRVARSISRLEPVYGDTGHPLYEPDRAEIRAEFLDLAAAWIDRVPPRGAGR